MLGYFWKYCHIFFQKKVGLRMRENSFIYGMRILLIILNFFPMYSVNYELLEYKNNKMDAFVYKFLSNFSHIMALIAYYITSFK